MDKRVHKIQQTATAVATLLIRFSVYGEGVQTHRVKKQHENTTKSQLCAIIKVANISKMCSFFFIIFVFIVVDLLCTFYKYQKPKQSNVDKKNVASCMLLKKYLNMFCVCK